MEIRPIRPEEHGAAARLLVEAYGAIDPFERTPAFEHSSYGRSLADVAGRARGAVVLVAADEEGIVGCVTYVPDAGGPYAEFDDEDAAGIRMLAVSSLHQGRGVGRALVEHCIERARRARKQRIILHTTWWMERAIAMYERRGFLRSPEGDIHIEPAEVTQGGHTGGIVLWAYELQLGDTPAR